MLNEQRVLDIIEQEHRAAGLDPPFVRPLRHGREAAAWLRIARRIVADADTDRRAAARTASMVGASITRGRTHL